MKKLVVLMTFVMGLFAFPAFAETGGIKTISGAVSTYVKKDKAYWTRVWHRKNAKKRGKKRYTKRRNKKRVAKRRSYRKSSGIVARVDISSQRMNVYDSGRLVHTWKVSTGRAGYGTPTGSWRIHRMHKKYFSKKYHGAPMPYSMFYYRGFAIHGTGSISRLGRPASHGCVRLHPSNAAKLFAMVRRKGGRVVVTH